MVKLTKIADIILQVCINPQKISCGMTCHNGVMRFAAVKKSINGTIELVYTDDKIPWWVSFCTPVLVHTDFSLAPVLFRRQNIGEEDPDTWLVKNEESIIPAGFTTDQIVNEYVSDKSELLSATVIKSERERLLDNLETQCTPLSIGVPLWDLANLYGKKINEPFILWKITADGSVIGYVENAKLVKLLNAWPDYEDLAAAFEDCKSYIASIVNSLDDSVDRIKVIVYSSDKKINISEIKLDDRIEFISIPVIKDVPVKYHEAYAIACAGEPSINLLPFEKIQNAKKVQSLWFNTSLWLRRGVLGVGISAVVLALLLLGIGVFKNLRNNDLAEIHEKVELVNSLTAKRDSLKSEIKRTGKLSGKESIVTSLLSDLQTIYPEGMWSDEIDINKTEKGWEVITIAFAKSTGLLGIFMNNVHKTKGFSDIRMVYSEQILLRGEKVIKCRIECLWRGVLEGDRK